MSEKLKYINVEDRKFCVKKFDAKSSLKLSKLIIAKILPVFNGIVGTVTAEGVTGIQTKIQEQSNVMEFLSLESVSKALDMISDDDMDKIINISLKHCYELLPAGQTQVLNTDGTFAVPDIEDDVILTVRLAAEAVLWSVGGFLDGSRLKSVLSPLSDLFRLNQLT